MVQLPTNDTASWAYSIAVAGKDVYVAGGVRTATGNNVGVYWKNGVMTMLTDSTVYSGASNIILSGNDVYIAGFGPSGPAYWKNGNIVNLPFLRGGLISGLAVSGNDVYVVGTFYNLYNQVATYWKNGVRDTLTVSPIISSASSIAVNGKDVYIAGTITGFLGGTAVYWKNGVQVNLTDNNTTGSAGGIALDASGNVYVCGVAALLINAQSLAYPISMIYWKNGDIGNPGWMSAGSSNMEITGIAVAGTDVYVAGSFGGFPTYWKNGSGVQFTGNAGQAYAIALAPQ